MLSVRDEATFSVEIEGRRYYWHLTTEKFEFLLQTFSNESICHWSGQFAMPKLILAIRPVVLVGGLRMPLIRKLVTRLFGRIPAMHFEVIAQWRGYSGCT